MVCFKYSTRIPLVHDASIMVFPLLEWCIQLWPAPLSLSLSLSLRKFRGRKRPEKHNQNNVHCAEDLHTRWGRGTGVQEDCKVPSACGSPGQAGGTGLSSSQPQPHSGNLGSALDLHLYFTMSWNEPFNTLRFIYSKALAPPNAFLDLLHAKHFVQSIVRIRVLMNVLWSNTLALVYYVPGRGKPLVKKSKAQLCQTWRHSDAPWW